MKVVSVVGARPQFVKAALVSKALSLAGLREVLVHTGQHYNSNMSDVFFDELGVPAPDVNLEVGYGSHAAQTAAMLLGDEEVMLSEKQDWVLVYGDTNSTLAGALAAAKLHIPVAHVEAGLRSFNRAMPEELNRIAADHFSSLLLCPSQTAVKNLAAEGVTKGVHLVGDVMYDAVLYFIGRARECSTVLKKLNLEPKTYSLATVHRAENTDNPLRLRSIMAAFAKIDGPVVFPIHPRTIKMLLQEDKNADGPPSTTDHGSRWVEVQKKLPDNVQVIEAVGYLDMLMLEQHAKMILTDSGGIQKEAYWLDVPCVTLRDETEWVETVEAGWNVLAGADTQRIVNAVSMVAACPLPKKQLYRDGGVAGRCVGLLESYEINRN